MARRPRTRVVRTSLVRPDLAETRAPKAANQALQFISPGLPQISRWNPHRAVNQGYLASWVVARCVEIIANDVAALPFLTGPRLPVSPTELPLTTPGSPLAQLVRRPAKGWPWPMFIRWMVTQRLVTGRHAAEIEWPGAAGTGRPVALWPLVSAELRPIQADGGVDMFSRFEYGRLDRPRKLTVDQVWLGQTPAPDDPAQPYSILQSAALDVSVAVMVGRYNYAFLANDARPAAVVVTDKFATQDDYDEFRDQFEARHQGPDNAGRTAFLEAEGGNGDVSQAVHIETLGISQKDSRMLEMHRASLEHVAMALGVPWSRLSAADRTWSNADAEDVLYWQSRVASLAGDLQAEFNEGVAARVGSDVGWFDLSSVRALQPRPPVDANGARALVEGNIATPEEVRPWFGLSGPGPEMPALPAGGATDASSEATGEAGSGARGGEPEAMAPAVEGGGGAASRSPGTDRVEGAVSGSLGSVPGVALRGAAAEGRAVRDQGLTAEEQEQRRASIWRTNDATVRSLETTWTKAWRRLFADQADAVAKAITRSRAKQVRAASTAREVRADLGVYDAVYWRAKAQALAEAMYDAAVTQGLARVNSMFAVSFDLEAPFVQDFIQARANQLAGQVTDTTYSAIQQALADGVANGASIDDLAASVQDVFDVASRSRAQTIARTEVISASNGSASLAAAQLPADVAAGQEWISTRDDRTRDDHADADGQVVAMGAPFEVGGESLLYPGDPDGDGGNVINCRCTIAFLTPKDMEGRSRLVSLRSARALVRMVPAGEFDEARFRAALLEAA